MEVRIKISSFLYSCLFIVFLPSLAFGQIGSKHALGFEGGGGISFLRGLENIEKYHDPAMCFTVGISYQYSFSESFSFFSAFDYERKGSIAKVTATDQSGNTIGDIVAHSNYDYLVLPLLGRYSFCGNNRLYINAGPYAGLLLKSESVTDESDFVPHTELDLSSESFKYDFGISAGIGVLIPISKLMTITVEIRNNLGMVNTRSAVIEEDGGSVKINSTNLLFGVTMPL